VSHTCRALDLHRIIPSAAAKRALQRVHDHNIDRSYSAHVTGPGGPLPRMHYTRVIMQYKKTIRNQFQKKDRDADSKKKQYGKKNNMGKKTIWEKKQSQIRKAPGCNHMRITNADL
jgi:hypothetical protein